MLGLFTNYPDQVRDCMECIRTDWKSKGNFKESTYWKVTSVFLKTIGILIALTSSISIGSAIVEALAIGEKGIAFSLYLLFKTTMFSLAVGGFMRSGEKCAKLGQNNLSGFCRRRWLKIQTEFESVKNSFKEIFI